jgi:hypothetical protein
MNLNKWHQHKNIMMCMYGLWSVFVDEINAEILC